MNKALTVRKPINNKTVGTFCCECDRQTIEHITHQTVVMGYLVTLELGYCSNCERETETAIKRLPEGENK